MRLLFEVNQFEKNEFTFVICVLFQFLLSVPFTDSNWVIYPQNYEAFLIRKSLMHIQNTGRYVLQTISGKNDIEQILICIKKASLFSSLRIYIFRFCCV